MSKLVLNICVGESGDRLQKAAKVRTDEAAMNAIAARASRSGGAHGRRFRGKRAGRCTHSWPPFCSACARLALAVACMALLRPSDACAARRLRRCWSS